MREGRVRRRARPRRRARGWASNAIHSAPPRCWRGSPRTRPTPSTSTASSSASRSRSCGIEGGVQASTTWCPTRCTLTVNRRFAPKYTPEEAEAQVRELLEGADDIEILQAQLGARRRTSPTRWSTSSSAGSTLPVRPKLGWTDVARFAAMGIPALNFGPGDPEIAHTQGEFVTRASIEQCYDVLSQFRGSVRRATGDAHDSRQRHRHLLRAAGERSLGSSTSRAAVRRWPSPG